MDRKQTVYAVKDAVHVACKRLLWACLEESLLRMYTVKYLCRAEQWN
jgi:hypothetical protein